MGRLKKISSLFLALVVVLAIFNVTSISAQEDFIVTVGQDKVFTAFNYHSSWFENDPNNPEPWPDQRVAYSEGNIARVSLAATPGHAGVAQAWTGVQFEWDLGQYTWEEVQNWPVRITIDFPYQIAAYWTQGNGSANAGINLNSDSVPWYDFIGSEAGYPGSRSKNVILTITTTVGQLEGWGRKILIQTYCQAHSVIDGGTSHNTTANVTINSIKLFIISPQRCVGAEGPQCGFPVKRNRDGSFTGTVSVGSILHDNCCIENYPDGYMCNNKGGSNPGVCRDEWYKALDNVWTRRGWPVKSGWGPYDEGEGDDITKVPARRSNPEAVHETITTSRLAAPSGTQLDSTDEAFCKSKKFRKKGKGFGICF